MALRLLITWLGLFVACGPNLLGADQPNFVVLFCDDLGYGDLGVQGHPTIRTPHLDTMAAEGLRFTEFYSAAAVCSPSRASLLTGRYPTEHGTINIYWHGLDTGMDLDELTVTQLLRDHGYATACIGKWHLGHDPQFLPERRGFESYYGVPYSNDMQIDPEMPFANDATFLDGWSLEKVRELSFDGPKKPKGGLVPLMQGNKVIEFPTDQSLLTARYTERAKDFITANKSRPFFLYLPYTMPHVPLYASSQFEGTSLSGKYGDVVEELDDSVGQILTTLKKLDLDEDTLVIFTSDNGPWLTTRWNGGSQGLLRGGKFTTWEGGMRVPGIAWWPGSVDPGVTSGMATTMDVFTTMLTLAGVAVPKDRTIDGLDLREVLLNAGESPREEMRYYRKDVLQAYRWREWKIHFRVQPEKGGKPGEWLDSPLLFNLARDPGEVHDVSERFPDIVRNLTERAKPFRGNLDKRQARAD